MTATYCCPAMRDQSTLDCAVHADVVDCPDVLVIHSEQHGPGLPVRDGGASTVAIRFCPWCATELHAAPHTPAAAEQPGPHRARRDSDVEAWIKAAREEHPTYEVWHAFDELLDDYRLHADTGTPLTEHACEGQYCCGSGAAAPSDGWPVRADTTLAEGQSLWIRTPEGMAGVSTMMGSTRVTVYDHPDHNPVSAVEIRRVIRKLDAGLMTAELHLGDRIDVGPMVRLPMSGPTHRPSGGASS